MANANTNEKERSFKNLTMKFGYTKNGERIVDGTVKGFLNKIYGTEDVCQVKTVNVAGNDRNVAELNTSLKVDSYVAAKLKFHFGKDVPVDSYVNVKASMWDKMGEGLAKWYLAEGDRMLLHADMMKLNEFNRKDGSVGYELNIRLYDFERLSKSTRENRTAKQATWLNGTSAPAAPAQPKAQANPLPDGFENSDFSDDGDLPF